MTESTDGSNGFISDDGKTFPTIERMVERNAVLLACTWCSERETRIIRKALDWSDEKASIEQESLHRHLANLYDAREVLRVDPKPNAENEYRLQLLDRSLYLVDQVLPQAKIRAEVQSEW